MFAGSKVAFPQKIKEIMIHQLWLIIANSLVMFLITIRYFQHFETTDSFLTWVYVPITIFGYTFVVFIAWLLFSTFFAFSRRLVFTLSALFFSALVYLVFIDSFIYNQYRFHINPFLIELFLTDYNEFGLSLLTTFLLICAAICLLGLEIGLIKLAGKIVKKNGTSKWAIRTAIALTICYILSQTLHAWAFKTDYSPITAVTKHLPFYFPIRANTAIHSIGLDNFVLRNNAPNHDIRYPQEELTCEEPAQLPNILFLILESWRSEMMDSLVTPNIYELSRKSQVFTNHISGGNVTPTGLFSLFYGLASTYWFTAGFDPASIGPPALIQLAQSNDYEFNFISISNMDKFKLRQTIFKTTQNDLVELGVKPVWKADSVMVDQFLSFLGRPRQRPFFSALFFSSSHFHFFYPPDYPEPFTPSALPHFAELNASVDPTAYLNRYRNSIHYNDLLLKKIFKTLADLNLMDETIIVITSDHAESFNDNRDGYWGHGSNFTQYQIKVPLIIYWPGKKPDTYGYQTSHVDVAPTILAEVFQCTNNFASIGSGQNLFKAEGRTGIIVSSYVNYAFVVEDMVYALNPGYVKKYTLFTTTEKTGELDPDYLLYFMNEKSRFFR